MFDLGLSECGNQYVSTFKEKEDKLSFEIRRALRVGGCNGGAFGVLKHFSTNRFFFCRRIS
jgi:hypothetical protein